MAKKRRTVKFKIVDLNLQEFEKDHFKLGYYAVKKATQALILWKLIDKIPVLEWFLWWI